MHGQGIHVPAQHHGATFAAAAQHGDNAAGGGARAVLQRQSGQSRHDLGRGLRCLQAQLGLGMDGAPQAHQLRQQLRSLLRPVHRGRAQDLKPSASVRRTIARMCRADEYMAARRR